MGNEDKPNDLDAERQEHRISLEKDAATLDAVPGADDSQKALYAEFANKDEAWKDGMDKKLVRKIDGRLLPILVVLYLLNFLDRYVFYTPLPHVFTRQCTNAAQKRQSFPGKTR